MAAIRRRNMVEFALAASSKGIVGNPIKAGSVLSTIGGNFWGGALASNPESSGVS